MPKKFLGHFFLLSVILLFSCENNSDCIDAEDFGDVEKEIIVVEATYSDSKMCYNNITDDSYKTNYRDIFTPSSSGSADIKPNALIDCLTKNVMSENNLTIPNKRLLVSGLNPTPTDFDSNLGCLIYKSDTVSRKICETICESECFQQNVEFLAARDTTEIPWKPNTPRGASSNVGVNVTPGSKIFISAEGEVNLNNTYGASGGLTSDLQVPLSSFSGNELVNLEFKGGFTYPSDLNTPDFYENDNPDATAISNMQSLARRSLVYFKPHPQGYLPSEIPIEADPEAWKCLPLPDFSNESDKIKCSFNDFAGEDEYLSPYSRARASRAFEVGTDKAYPMTSRGGFIRYNGDEVEKTTEIDFPNIDATTNEAIYSSPSEGLINFKMIPNDNCNDAKIDVSVIDKGILNKIYYKVTNLKVSTNYTTKNIPAYPNSTIKIKVYNLTAVTPVPASSNCSIQMKTQRYLDIKIPNSGVAQFKIVPSTGDSCNLYGRIINPDGKKMVYGFPFANEVIGISNNADNDKAFILSANKGFSNQGGYKVKNVYLGLNAYGNKDHKDLADSNCKVQLKISDCAIENANCLITSDQYSSITPFGCYDGKGKDGTIDSGKAGNGGGGGGNIGGLAGSYEINSAVGRGGKRGQSYINPEFQLGNWNNILPEDLVTSVYKGAPSGEAKGKDGLISFNWEGEQAGNAYNIPTLETSMTMNFPAGTPKLKYRIYGGGGGAGGNCNSNTGGPGADGHYFSGTLDFTNLSLLPSTSFTLKIKVGSGGRSGNDCGLSNVQNASTNSDTKLKGGNGGVGGGQGSTTSGGGAGGSASYISLVRSDEIGETTPPIREDFLVIAGGGGGGGGAVTNLNGFNGDDSNYVITNNLQSTANGLRLAVTLEEIPQELVGVSSDYYEYDDFFTKTTSNSIDPLKNVNVGSTYSAGFFVRKDQILRILPKSFESTFQSSSLGVKKCGVGMIMKIIPRPAVLCLSGITEAGFSNPSCKEDRTIPSETDTTTTSEVHGCMARTTCVDPSPVAALYYCQNPLCAQITCTISGSDTDKKGGCTRTIPTPPPTCDAGCPACAAKKIDEMESSSPKIDLNADICYNFDDVKNISVHKFLEKYNNAGNSDAKSTIINAFSIKKITKFDSQYNFGNFEPYTKSTNTHYFKTKDSISFDSGKLDAFLIKNSDFTRIQSIVYNDDSISDINIPDVTNSNRTGNITVQTVRTKTQQKGNSLLISLCKESSDKSADCFSLTPPIIAEFVKASPDTASINSFKFNSFGILERVKALSTYTDPARTIPTISDCPGMSPGDNYICYTAPGETEADIKRHRLIFKIKDSDSPENYSNNTGQYNVKVEKKESGSSRAGGIVNGILQPIIENLDGKIDDPNTAYNEATPGIVRNFYVSLIRNPLYKSLITVTIVLALSFYGMGYLMGVNELKHSEVVKILFKIAFIYLFTSTLSGWSWFNKFFVEIFKNATDYISYSIAETFDHENSSELRTRIIANNFYDKGILFQSVDKVINLILAGAVQKKILALLFSSIFGWIYLLILYYCLMTYIYAVANSMLLYITCQIITSILFVLGPIFFLFLMFKVTKEMFDNWLKALIGFSLQQIFLVLTLALFNSFVVGFLKLALGYRVCWTNVLSLNLIISKVSLLNFWTVAGTNAPENTTEDSPDESFGNDQNMPSIYLFLYLMIIVSLMKKFIEMFTNLAVTIAGGLKATTIGADAASMGKSIFKSASAGVSSLYQKTAGRVIANVDNTLFDSGSIADNRRKTERKKFAQDMKTRVTLNKEGNAAVSEYKKENALKLSEMSVDKQKETLESVKKDAIKKYASENGIKDKELDRLTNTSGLNYNGNNLFGAALQAGKQAAFSGGALRNTLSDKKVDTSFSKVEANSALKKMDSADQEKFISAVKEGDLHVNKGKIENARSMAITAVKAPVKAIFNPKTTALSAVGAVASVARSSANAFKPNEDKKEVIAKLEASGEITKAKKIPLPNFVKNWARTDEEKKLIRDKTREFSRKNQVNLPKLTSKSVIKDLEANKKYTERTVANQGDIKFNSNNKSIKAKLGRVGDRAANLFKQDRSNKSARVEAMNNRNFEKIIKEKSDPENKILKEKKDSLVSLDTKINESLKATEQFKKFNILEEAKESLTKTGNISDEIRDKMKANDMSKYVEQIENGEKWNKLTKGIAGADKNTKLRYINDLTNKEVSKNSKLGELVEKRKENRKEIGDIDLKLSAIEKRESKREELEKNFKDAVKINKENKSVIDKYENKSFYDKGLNYISSKATSITQIRPIARNFNSIASRVKGKTNDEKIYKSKPFLKEREKYKKAVKSVKKFNKLEKPDDVKKFVDTNKKTLTIIQNKEALATGGGSSVGPRANAPQDFAGGNNSSTTTALRPPTTGPAGPTGPVLSGSA